MIRRAPLHLRALGVPAAAVLCTAAAGGPILHVDDDAPPGGDGSSWGTAYRFLRDALDAAAAGAEVRVAQGVYRPDRSEAAPGGSGDTTETFDLDADLALLGGFAGLGAPDPDDRDVVAYETVLSGDLLGNDAPGFQNRADNSLRIVTVGAVVVLDGFTITGGNAPDEGAALAVAPFSGGDATVNTCTFTGNEASGHGGAVSAGNVTLTGCSFLGNAADDGGALYVEGWDVEVTGCLFQDNEAFLSGGAVFTLDSRSVFTDCTFSGNSSFLGSGGAMRHQQEGPALRSCLFADNVSGFLGGAVSNFDCTGVGIVQCVFFANAADGAFSSGGALHNDDSTVSVLNCAFLGNSTTGFGGGAYNLGGAPLLYDCLFSGNAAALDGGGLANAAADALVVNCTFSGNAAEGFGGGMYNFDSFPAVANSILWGNTDGTGSGLAAQLRDDAGSATAVDYSCLQGQDGSFGGTGNIGDDPLFTDAAGPDGTPGTFDDDLRLLSGSPCIDAADNAAGLLCLVDLDGDVRTADDPATPDTGAGTPPIVDMGPYEFGSLPAPDCDEDLQNDLCQQDCNGNAVADACDLADGTSPDCDGNGVPDECDLAEGASPDCNGNGIPDECDVAGGASPDCNGNGAPDECDLADGTSTDCNGNAVPDVCDLLSGFGTDCNANGVLDACDALDGFDCNGNGLPDECDVAGTYSVQSPALSPLFNGSPQSFTLLSPPEAAGGEVLLSLSASADFGGAFEYVFVRINGVGLGQVFADGGTCSDPPDTAQIAVDAGFYNTVVGEQGPHAEIEMVPGLGVGEECAGGSFIMVAVEYAVTPFSQDDDGDGIPDECAPGDLDGDGVVGVTDFLTLLAAWGPCPAPPEPCPADLDDDGAVGTTDLLILLANWTA